MKISPVLKNKGFSLVEVAVAVGIFGLTALIAASLMQNISTLTSSNGSASNLEQTRIEIIANINSEAAWANTLAAGPNGTTLDCIKTATDCLNKGGEILIFNSSAAPGGRVRTVSESGAVVNAPETTSESSLGFTSRGTVCFAYSLAGNDDCPYKYTATWTAICPAGQDLKVAGGMPQDITCRNPIVDVNVVLGFHPANRARFPNIDTTKLNIHIAKSQTATIVPKLCTMMGTVYDAVSKVCVTAVPTDCTAAAACNVSKGALVKGFNSNGTPNCDCATPYTVLAPKVYGDPNNVLVGTNIDGSGQWAPGIIPIMMQVGSITNPPLMGGGGT